MPLALVLPDGYGSVMLVAGLSTVLSIAHMLAVSEFRKKARVPLPNAYASANEAAASVEKYHFNCAQRAQANYNEHHASFLLNLLVAGLQFPRAATLLGATWVVGRAVFLWGYVSSPPTSSGSGRYKGSFWLVGHTGLLALSLYTAGSLAYSALA